MHYAKIGVERRRSTCSAIFGTKSRSDAKLSFADKHEDEDNTENIEEQPRGKDQRLVIYNESPRRIFSHSKSSMEFYVSVNSDDENYEEDVASSPKFIDAEEKVEEMPYKNKNFLNAEEDMNLLSLVLVPLQNGGNPSSYWSNHNLTNLCSTLSSPLPNDSYLNSGGGIGSKSCPATPQMPRRRYLKEGATQLTSLSTLCTHHRYLFLFNDLLLISKQK